MNRLKANCLLSLSAIGIEDRKLDLTILIIPTNKFRIKNRSSIQTQCQCISATVRYGCLRPIRIYGLIFIQYIAYLRSLPEQHQQSSYFGHQMASRHRIGKVNTGQIIYIQFQVLKLSGLPFRLYISKDLIFFNIINLWKCQIRKQKRRLTQDTLMMKAPGLCISCGKSGRMWARYQAIAYKTWRGRSSILPSRMRKKKSSSGQTQPKASSMPDSQMVSRLIARNDHHPSIIIYPSNDPYKNGRWLCQVSWHFSLGLTQTSKQTIKYKKMLVLSIAQSRICDYKMLLSLIRWYYLYQMY